MAERRSPKPDVAGSSPAWPARPMKGGAIMKKIKAFIMESYGELKKVVWPGRESVMSSAKVVIVSTLVFALFFGLVDFLLSKGLIGLFEVL
jgi:preprotein translocase subunit SecE